MPFSVYEKPLGEDHLGIAGGVAIGELGCLEIAGAAMEVAGAGVVGAAVCRFARRIKPA
jgi:hypothetical protein